MQARTMAQENARQEEAKPEQQPERKQLVDEYRKVGPKAINAALLCQKPKKKDEPARLSLAREDA
ncbi:hypothetical protein [Chelativorans sp. M5D2P16]|uniref:hypothetical protein n=1 Tax=Chelativorans sp. M5D2P16 TaxID=3095678 RepID=UPI002ACAA8B6|nr:hypothetical protein [Chelativorans sp. M5D2P16]MDZ5696259.1 hypothetical protein [Chelativorans sp. M5D2P16]